MNWTLFLKDLSRTVICIIIILGFVYCVINDLSCKEVLQPYAIAVLSAQLGLESVIKLVEGIPNGRYTKGEK